MIGSFQTRGGISFLLSRNSAMLHLQVLVCSFGTRRTQEWKHPSAGMGLEGQKYNPGTNVLASGCDRNTEQRPHLLANSENLGAGSQTPAVGFSWREGRKESYPEVFARLLCSHVLLQLPCFLIYYFTPIVFQKAAFVLASIFCSDQCLINLFVLFVCLFFQNITGINTGEVLERTKFPSSPVTKNPTSIWFEFWWFPPCPTNLPLPHGCASPWQREDERYSQKPAWPHVCTPQLQRCPVAAPPAHWALSSGWARGCSRALGPRQEKGLLKSLGVATTLPALCSRAVVDGSGGCRQDGEAGQPWSAHTLPLSFVIGYPASSPAAT